MNDTEYKGEPRGSCLVYALIGALVLAVFTGAIVAIFTVAESDRAARSQAAYIELKERYQALAKRAAGRIQREEVERRALEESRAAEEKRDRERLGAALKKLESAGVNDHKELAAAIDDARERAMAYGAGLALESGAAMALVDGSLDEAEAAALVRLLKSFQAR